MRHGRDEGPDLDEARHAAQMLMGLWAGGVVGEAPPVRRMGEDAVDSTEHGRGRAERQDEVDAVELARRGPGLAGKMPVHLVELVRSGALERIDRLFLVADREEGAVLLGPARAGEELVADGLQDLPLMRRGILGLVDQDVVDAAVELVEHPGRARRLQEVAGPLDEVFEVEQAPTLLRRVVMLENGGRDCDQRRGPLGGLGCLALRQEPDEALALAVERIAERRLFVAQGRRQIDVGPGLALLRQKHVEV